MAKPSRPRAITKDQEVSTSRIYRNTKKPTQLAFEWVRSAFGAGSVIASLAFISFIFPGMTETSVLLTGIVYWLHVTDKQSLPLKMPIYSGMIDPNNISLVTRKPAIADGMFFYGNDQDDGNKEVWLAKKDACTHTIMLATTGGGKTEALLSMASNSLVQGSGFIFIDGKADVSLLQKVYSLCRTFGREDDLLVINYNTGNRDISFDTPDMKISNTLNPFSFGSSKSLTQLLVSLMSDSGGKGDFWKDRAISLVESIIPALVWKRDKQKMLLDVSTIREYLNLSRIIELRKIEEMPINIQESLRAYCENLAGWNEKKGAQQGDTTLEQHGYLQMQFTRTLGSLGDVYGHIFRTPLGEVDMYDIITNRRILLVMIPALENSPSELANLGRIIVALIKSMMASALGDKFEGDVYEIVDDRFTNAETPYQTFFDEYASYIVEGSSVMQAQARSLNIAMTVATQNYSQLKNASETEASTIMGNSNTKIFGKIEDAETFNIYKDLVGDSYVTNVGGYKQSDGFLNGYSANQEASIEQVSRANFLDMKDQAEGEMRMMFASTLVRMRMFFANPSKPKSIRINEFIRIKAPSEESLARVNDNMGILVEKINSEEFAKSLPEPAQSRDISFLMESLSRHGKMPPMKRSAAVIADYDQENRNVSMFQEDEDEDDTEIDVDEMFSAKPRSTTERKTVSAFSQPSDFPDASDDLLALNNAMVAKDYGDSQADKLIAATVGVDYIDAARSVSQASRDNDDPEFDRAAAVITGLMDAEEVRDDLERIGVEAGASEADAGMHAKKVIDNLDSLTTYPKSEPEPIEAEEYVEAIGMLDDLINEFAEEAAEDQS